MADEDRTKHRLQSVELDEESLAAVSRDQEQARQIGDDMGFIGDEEDSE